MSPTAMSPSHASLNFVPGPASSLFFTRAPLTHPRPRPRPPPLARHTPPHPLPHLLAPLQLPPPPATRGLAGPRTLVWFRTDLRLHDHPALTHALSHPLVTPLPVYIFDPRHFGPAPSSSTSATSHFLRTGRHRLRFLLDAVAALRAALRARGSDLVVRVGHPEKLLPLLAAQFGAREVVCHRAVDTHHVAIERAVASTLTDANLEFTRLWADTLYHPDDLPFAVQDTPDAYVRFRETVQSSAPIRPALDAPGRMPSLRGVAPGELPTPGDLGVGAEHMQERLKLPGGEEHALERLGRFVSAVKGGEDASAVEFGIRIAPWMQMGCISPRTMYWEIRDGAGIEACSSTGFELVWRDFGKFVRAKFSEERLGNAERLPRKVATRVSVT